MPSGSVLRAEVPGPPLIVVRTVSADVSMTVMLPDSPLPTQTWEPSGVAAIDMGRLPAVTVPRTRPVSAEITVTELEFVSATYTFDPSGVMVTAYGSAPAAITRARRPVAALMTHRLPVFGLVT